MALPQFTAEETGVEAIPAHGRVSLCSYACVFYYASLAALRFFHLLAFIHIHPTTVLSCLLKMLSCACALAKRDHCFVCRYFYGEVMGLHYLTLCFILFFPFGTMF